MKNKLFTDGTKLGLVLLLHIMLYVGGLFVMDNSEDKTIILLLAIIVVGLVSVILPLNLLSRWDVTFKTLKIAVLLFWLSDAIVAFIPYSSFFIEGLWDEVVLSSIQTLLQVIKYGMFIYGMAYYLIRRQEKKRR